MMYRSLFYVHVLRMVCFRHACLCAFGMWCPFCFGDWFLCCYQLSAACIEDSARQSGGVHVAKQLLDLMLANFQVDIFVWPTNDVMNIQMTLVGEKVPTPDVCGYYRLK